MKCDAEAAFSYQQTRELISTWKVLQATTKTRVIYGNSPGMRVNTVRYINSTRGASSKKDAPSPPIPCHSNPSFQAHSATQVCTGIRQNQFSYVFCLQLCLFCQAHGVGVEHDVLVSLFTLLHRGPCVCITCLSCPQHSGSSDASSTPSVVTAIPASSSAPPAQGIDQPDFRTAAEKYAEREEALKPSQHQSRSFKYLQDLMDSGKGKERRSLVFSSGP